MTAIGRIASALAAISCGHNVWYWNRNCASPSWIV
jgi:hypothetical protein